MDKTERNASQHTYTHAYAHIYINIAYISNIYMQYIHVYICICERNERQ